MKTFRLNINGSNKEVTCGEDAKLLDVIRNDFHLTGTKRGCGQDYCGACSVILNGKVVRSCSIPLKLLPDNARIVTIEGIGTMENPHPIQKAFSYAGAIQCGYCTPGMIIVAKALLDENPSPAEPEIRQAFKHNLCRCTGYNSIIRAVQLAGQFLRGEVKEEDIKVDTSHGTFGKRVPRPSSLAKATGSTQFGDDVPLPANTLYLKVVRSPHHHALIKSISTAAAERMPGVLGVLTAKDVPGTNRIGSGQTALFNNYVPNECVLCDKKVGEFGSPVAVVVAETLEQAAAAVAKVEVEYEVLPVYPTPKESLAEDAIPVVPEYENNNPFTGYIKKGIQDKAEAKKALQTSDVLVSQRFVTNRQAHLVLEPDNAIAYIDERDRITVMSKSVSIHNHIRELAPILAVKPDRIRWIENYSGGTFGYKHALTCEAFAAIAAMKYRRPCKIVYSMAETIMTTGKRSRVWLNGKIGATREGKITGFVYDFDLDCGASDYLGSVLLFHCHYYIGGPHNIPKLFGEGRICLTNNNRATACCRGLGATQIQLASEVLLDMLAVKAGKDPLEFRYLNAWREGNVGNWGGKLDCYPYPAMIEKMFPLYKAAKEKANKESTAAKKRGVGVAGAFFGCGRDDNPDRSTAWVELNPDNGVTVYATWADPGSGGDIGILSIASKAMGDLPPEKIRMVTRDSSLAPNCGPSVASRQTSITGTAIRLACEALLKAMKDKGCKDYDDMLAKKLPLRYEGVHICDQAGCGGEDIHGYYVQNWQYNLQMAEVEVETATGKVNVLKMTTITDAGVIHNPLAVEGQCEGGANMGVGLALWEDFKPGETDTLIKGGIPDFLNSPPIEVYNLETYRKRGTFGGSGYGEAVMMGAAPAVINALYDACGIRITEFPAKPERVLAALKKKGQKK